MKLVKLVFVILPLLPINLISLSLLLGTSMALPFQPEIGIPQFSTGIAHEVITTDAFQVYELRYKQLHKPRK